MRERRAKTLDCCGECGTELRDHLVAQDDTAETTRQRALSMWRLNDQLWYALNPDDTEWSNWAWPMDIYADNGELFAIYTQGGHLYRVDLSVSGDTLTVGDPIQVTEAFPAVQQSRANFFVRRQADGQYRWVMIAATSVLNRVGELDSSELFQSFIDEAERSGEYPRLDFYHLGLADADAWEFGTADYLAHDGVCYIASGLFDDHPLAHATIRATERDEPGAWGASIEFYTREEAELMVVQVGDDNPVELKVPIYRKGKNTRISVLKEQDAAGLFTTLGVSREVLRMRSDILEKLTELYGNEEEARAFVDEFGIEVDGVNQAVKEQGLIHRGKKGAAASANAPAGDVEDDEGEDGVTPPGAAPQIDLDEEAARAIAGEVVKLDVFQKMHAAINAMPDLLATQAEQITTLTQSLEAKDGEISDLRKRLGAQNKRLQALEREDAEKQQEWLEDLPATQTMRVGFRPRYQHNGDPSDELNGADDPLSAENIRKKVLAEPLPVE